MCRGWEEYAAKFMRAHLPAELFRQRHRLRVLFRERWRIDFAGEGDFEKRISPRKDAGSHLR